MKRILLLMMCYFIGIWSAQAEIKNGDIDGSSASWNFDTESGMLTILGEGSLKSFTIMPDDSPWHGFADDIKSVVVEEGITSIGGSYFSKLENLASVTLPETLTSIGVGSFLTCTNLTSITIPESVTEIEALAFFGCTNLAEITVLNPIPVNIAGNRVFEEIAPGVKLYVPALALSDYQGAPVWKDFLPLPINSNPPTTYHTINLEVADGIWCDYEAGKLTVADGGYLYLQFQAEEHGVMTDNILFLVDGVETTFTVNGNTGGYILNPVGRNHTILIALKEYTVTLPETKGVTFDVGAGTHQVAYGDPFRFSLTLGEGIEAEKVHIYANGIEIQPDASRSVTLTYTIDKVITPITVAIEGADDPTGNAVIAEGKVSIAIDNGQLIIDNLNSQTVDVAVYNISGKNVVSLRALRGSKTFDLQPGIYLVKVADTVYKVRVN